METKLRELLDKIYELEGLVHLALKRDDSSEDFLRLISKKGKEVGKICDKIKDKEGSHKETEETTELDTFPLNEYLIEEEAEEKKNSLNPYEVSSVDKVGNEIDIIETQIQNSTLKEQETQRGKLVFTINDRFRFRKELFENSDADFNTTLALVASMDNYEEAEDYFINEEGFDPSKPEVKEFLQVIKKYFK